MSRLVVVSNRVADPRKTAAGGLAVAVGAALAETGGLWFGSSGTVVEELLRGLGVDLGQGFLFGPPTSAEEAERLFTGAAMPGSSTLGDPREPR